MLGETSTVKVKKKCAVNVFYVSPGVKGRGKGYRRRRWLRRRFAAGKMPRKVTRCENSRGAGLLISTHAGDTGRHSRSRNFLSARRSTGLSRARLSGARTAGMRTFYEAWKTQFKARNTQNVPDRVIDILPRERQF